MLLKHNSLKLIFLIVILGLLITELLVLQSPLFKLNPAWLNLTITADLSLVIPVVVFFLIKQWHPLKLRTLLSFIVVGTFIASLLTGTKLWIVAIAIEVAFILIVLFRIRFFIASFLKFREDGYPLRQAIKLSGQRIINLLSSHKALKLLWLDINVWRYSVFSYWQTPSTNSSNSFSYAKLANPSSNLAIALIIIFESIPVHFFIHQWNPVWAWVHTVVNIYGLMFLFADYRAMQLKPITIGENTITVNYGFRANAVIPLNQVKSIEAFEDPVAEKASNIANLSCLKTPQIIITLYEAVEVKKLFGSRQCDVFYLSVEYPKEFKKVLLQQGDMTKII